MKEKCNFVQRSPLMRATARRRDRGRRVGNSRFYKIKLFPIAVGAEFAHQIERRCRVRCLWSACSCILHMWRTALVFSTLKENFPNFRKSWSFLGNFREIKINNSRKFHEIHEIWLLWFKKAFFSLARSQIVNFCGHLTGTLGDFNCGVGVGVGVGVGEPEKASEPSSTPAVGLGKRYRLYYRYPDTGIKF